MKTQADTTPDRREFLKMAGTGVAAAGLLSTAGAALAAPSKTSTQLPNGADNFYASDKVTLQRVTFKNQYRMTVVGNLFVPKSLDRKNLPSDKAVADLWILVSQISDAHRRHHSVTCIR